VQQQLGELALKNSQLIEQFDQARIVVQQRQAAADKAEQAATRAAARLTAARHVLGQSLSAMYEGGSFSATGALLTSESGSSYLTQLDTMSMISQHNAQLVHEVGAIKRQATRARDNAAGLLADARQKLSALNQQRTQVQNQVNKYKNLLDTLTAAQRAAYRAAQNPTPAPATVAKARTHLSVPGATPAAARKAVEFALKQVGKPYVWGAAGPSSYDCSGLTMASYASAGISLPHSAAQQYNYGHHVSFDQLRPGDLLFFYQPIGHVAMYIGDGLMVSAPETGELVKVIPANTFGSSYTGATRLVGN
jgi:cell wall-associated NlpC family hydrolase